MYMCVPEMERKRVKKRERESDREGVRERKKEKNRPNLLLRSTKLFIEILAQVVRPEKRI